MANWKAIYTLIVLQEGRCELARTGTEEAHVLLIMVSTILLDASDVQRPPKIFIQYYALRVVLRYISDSCFVHRDWIFSNILPRECKRCAGFSGERSSPQVLRSSDVILISISKRERTTR